MTTPPTPAVKDEQLKLANVMTIPLTNSSEVALVDSFVYPIVSRFRWRLNQHGYPVTGNTSNKTTCFLHHMLLQCPPGKLPYHKDRNPLNNRFSNLRPATKSQNASNSKLRTDSTTKLRGVSFFSRDGNYVAHIRVNGKSKNLGYFQTPESAARAYDMAAIIAFGEFATLNFPTKQHVRSIAVTRKARVYGR